MMKVLVINTVRFKLNGISAVIKNYYTAINKTDLRMDFVTIDDPSPEYKAFFDEYNLKCYVLYKKHIVKYFTKIIKICQKEKYDIVHVHGNSANMSVELLACWLGGVKIRIAHSHNTSSLHPITHKLFFPLFTALCTDRIACGMDAGRWLFHAKPFNELKNGIDVDKYHYNTEMRVRIRSFLNISDTIVIGHIGNFIVQKNHTFLLEWFAELVKEHPKYRLLLISDGMLFDKMKEKAKRLGIDEYTIFLGKTMEIENYLQAMDLFVLPSLYEGLPVVLVEAQAAGLPCLVSDTVAREADLTHSCSFVSISTSKTWVDHVLTIAIDENKREETSYDNCQIIKDAGYDINANANELKNIYRRSLERKIKNADL